jgi:DNA-binding transcriptional MerR regulator
MEEGYITLKEVAKRARVSPSLLYHYIKMGLLERPEHIPNTKAGRGSLAVYREGVVDAILQIRSRLESTHSLKTVNEDIKMEEEKRKSLLLKITNKINKLIKRNQYNSEEFKREISNLSGLTRASSVTATLYTGEGTTVKWLRKDE